MWFRLDFFLQRRFSEKFLHLCKYFLLFAAIRNNCVVERKQRYQDEWFFWVPYIHPVYLLRKTVISKWKTSSKRLANIFKNNNSDLWPLALANTVMLMKQLFWSKRKQHHPHSRQHQCKLCTSSRPHLIDLVGSRSQRTSEARSLLQEG